MQVQAVNLGVNVNPIFNSTNRLFCRLDGLSPAVREQKRVTTLKQLGLLDTETIPIFDEATQTAARFIEAPICLLGIMVEDNLCLKSAVGLSRLGLMNDLASSRKISRQEAYSTYIVDSEQPLVIEDTLAHPVFARSSLVQHYGIRAFLGTPLITAEGDCLGTLGVMDLVPRKFTPRDLEFLTITARWCLREFERNHLCNSRPPQEDQWLNLVGSPFAKAENPDSDQSSVSASINSIKLQLLQKFMEEFRTPLTSVIGMSSVLQEGAFGSMTQKQKEYLKIIHNSGQQMNALVQEIFKLGMSPDNETELQLNPVNIEMLAQNTINSVGEVVIEKRQTLRLSVEPGKRIWLLDKRIIEQALYYLVISILESAEVGGEIRIHISRRSKTLNIAVWVSHPWLGDGLPQVNFRSLSTNQLLSQLEPSSTNSWHGGDPLSSTMNDYVLRASSLEKMIHQPDNEQLPPQNSQELLGLILSCHLVESHGGKIMVQGSSESGYRYVLMLPKIGTDSPSYVYSGS
ncbi:MAG: GAF domain-containing sensor histidine kinase [Crocosphaera sp.]|nr:GAF domain-containing sensor histidine kinase [Crocosphaera sp.]